jgi:hypothetical protein
MRHSFLIGLNKTDHMKPIVEFLLACVLLLIAGCSAIAGIFTANLWTAIFAAGSITGLVLMLIYGSKNRQ